MGLSSFLWSPVEGQGAVYMNWNTRGSIFPVRVVDQDSQRGCGSPSLEALKSHLDVFLCSLI